MLRRVGSEAGPVHRPYLHLALFGAGFFFTDTGPINRDGRVSCGKPVPKMGRGRSCRPKLAATRFLQKIFTGKETVYDISERYLGHVWTELETDPSRTLREALHVAVNATGGWTGTELFRAVRGRRTQLVELLEALVESGVSPHTVDADGATVLHLVSSVQRRNVGAVRLLLGLEGLDINRTDGCGMTALHRFVLSNHCLEGARVMDVFLRYPGIDIRTRDFLDTCPLEAAMASLPQSLAIVAMISARLLECEESELFERFSPILAATSMKIMREESAARQNVLLRVLQKHCRVYRECRLGGLLQTLGPAMRDVLVACRPLECGGDRRTALFVLNGVLACAALRGEVHKERTLREKLGMYQLCGVDPPRKARRVAGGRCLAGTCS